MSDQATLAALLHEEYDKVCGPGPCGVCEGRAARLIAAGVRVGDCGHIGVEEAIAQGQRMLAASETAADREITRLNARIVALNAEVLDRMDQWHRDSLARDELARQQAREIARLRAALATDPEP